MHNSQKPFDRDVHSSGANSPNICVSLMLNHDVKVRLKAVDEQ